MKTRYDGAATLRFEAVYDNRTPTDLPSRLVLFPTFLLRKRICLTAVTLHCIATTVTAGASMRIMRQTAISTPARAAITTSATGLDRARASRNYDERDWFGPRPRIRRV